MSTWLLLNPFLTISHCLLIKTFPEHLPCTYPGREAEDTTTAVPVPALLEGGN